ncbi:MAG: divergent PAP2 family protein [Planctomycetales bacterium]|nr:divergent PAP2 family protein [Planctomycetales bacterium]
MDDFRPKIVSMYLGYIFAPPAAWLVAGTLKFIVNSYWAKQWAFGQIGLGGFPSTHASVAAAALAAILTREGPGHPATAVAVALTLLTAIDAADLRRRVGRHAELLNQIANPLKPLRERMGHKPHEIIGGLFVGATVGIVCGRVL